MSANSGRSDADSEALEERELMALEEIMDHSDGHVRPAHSLDLSTGLEWLLHQLESCWPSTEPACVMADCRRAAGCGVSWAVQDQRTCHSTACLQHRECATSSGFQSADIRRVFCNVPQPFSTQLALAGLTNSSRLAATLRRATKVWTPSHCCCAPGRRLERGSGRRGCPRVR